MCIIDIATSTFPFFRTAKRIGRVSTQNKDPGLNNRIQRALFHEIFHSSEMNIFIVIELRQAGSLSLFFILFLPEGMISTAGKNLIKDQQVPISYSITIFFKGNICASQSNPFPLMALPP